MSGAFSALALGEGRVSTSTVLLAGVARWGWPYTSLVLMSCAEPLWVSQGCMAPMQPGGKPWSQL